LDFIKLILIKKILKKILPTSILQLKRNYIAKQEIKKFSKMEINEIFEEIYNKKLWTPEEEKKSIKFYSGIGSHYEEFTNIYIDKIRDFLIKFPSKPSVVDLGCGDFFIGAKLRQYCDKYIAIDIFKDLIDLNKNKFSDLDVDFKTLDITKDQLPSGEVCFIRQVLQHLSNDLINKFLNLMSGKYKYIVITEHLPQEIYFKANIDILTGPNIRINKNSAVVLTEKPFNLKVINEKNICSIRPKKIKGFEGVINTKILQLY